MKKILLLLFALCSSLWLEAQKTNVIMGDEQTSEYFPILKGKRIAIFSNHTGMIGDKHLLFEDGSTYPVALRRQAR